MHKLINLLLTNLLPPNNHRLPLNSLPDHHRKLLLRFLILPYSRVRLAGDVRAGYGP